jgi:hypothetical protein|uniref:Uncharacterized protein n=1 Tax=Arabidopsis thaliana TaxID=3702 RepID=Q0WMJ5_ARATH|nr:hypothetical protein [Arabidopsis thaliana]
MSKSVYSNASAREKNGGDASDLVLDRLIRIPSVSGKRIVMVHNNWSRIFQFKCLC